MALGSPAVPHSTMWTADRVDRAGAEYPGAVSWELPCARWNPPVHTLPKKCTACFWRPEGRGVGREGYRKELAVG